MLDVFNSPNVPMLNKFLIMFHILIIFGSFYVAVYSKSWKLVGGIFVLFDGFVGTSLFYLFSPNPVVPGEAFVLKVFMAMLSLGIVQWLTVHHRKLSNTSSSQA